MDLARCIASLVLGSHRRGIQSGCSALMEAAAMETAAEIMETSADVEQTVAGTANHTTPRP